MDDDEDGEEPGRVKWLPFFRNFGMVSSFSGIGPEKIMFSTFLQMLTDQEYTARTKMQQQEGDNNVRTSAIFA